MDQKRILPDRKPYCGIFCKQPVGIDLEHIGQKVKNVGARNRFSADILADMAFSKLHTAPLGRSDQIDLLELFRLHGQFQTVGKGFICHRKSP